MFSNLSPSSISLATVTPSLVMRGAPNDLSSTTLRPFGPSVTLTASERISTPWSIFARASVENRTSFAAIFLFPDPDRLLLEDVYDVGLFHDEEVLAVDLLLCAGPLAVQNLVADLHVELHERAVLGGRAR